VLASEQFRRAVSDNSEPYRDSALFLSGVPGAGKSSYVLRANSPFPYNLRVLYEGQLFNAGQAISKINQAIEEGLAAEITIVHISSEQALHIQSSFSSPRTRSEHRGYGSIQGRLPDGLRAVHERFGSAVKLHIIDRRGTLDTVLLHGWHHLPILDRREPMKTLNANSPKSLSETTIRSYQGRRLRTSRWKSPKGFHSTSGKRTLSRV